MDLEGKEEVEGWSDEELTKLKREVENIIAEKVRKVLKSGKYGHFTDVLAGILVHLAVDYINLSREIGGEI